jgi:signal transduction histidine kinase
LKPFNRTFSNGFAEKDFFPDAKLMEQISQDLKLGNYIIEKGSLRQSPLKSFFSGNNLEQICLKSLGTGETPLGILAFGLGHNQYKNFNILAFNQIGQNLSVAINKYFYNVNAKEHAILKEHNHISRELHDSLAQQLSAVSNKLEFIERHITGKQDPTGILPELQHLKELVDLTNVDVRETITGLRILKQEDNIPFPEIIKKYLLFFQKTCPELEIEVNIEEKLQEIPFKVQIQLFRIIQEGFANIRKHSQATKADISLVMLGNQMILKISDNGVGFDLKTGKAGCGLIILQERAEEIGADLKVDSALNKGTCLSVTANTYFFE